MHEPMVMGLVRYLVQAHALRKRVLTEVARRRGQIVEHGGLRTDFGELAAGLAAIHRDDDVVALLDAPAAHLCRAIRRLAVRELDRVPATGACQVRVAGLLEIICEACGRRYPGNELHMRRRDTEFATEYEGACPRGHVLPALAAEVVVR